MSQTIHKVNASEAVLGYIRDIVIAQPVSRRRPARCLHAGLALSAGRRPGLRLKAGPM